MAPTEKHPYYSRTHPVLHPVLLPFRYIMHGNKAYTNPALIRYYIRYYSK